MRRHSIALAFFALTIVTAGVSARELNELEGITYSNEVPPYAAEVAPDAQIPPPLNPDQFKDPEIREMYKTAFLLRRVLLQLPCHCACHERAGHKSLYACYVAAVGDACYSAECEVCLDEAKIAAAMNKQGASVEDIRGALAAQFGDAPSHTH